MNRGEPAMRLIHAVRELREELGMRIRTIALFTDADQSGMFVREADDAYRIGPTMSPGPDGKARSTYLDYARLKTALEATRADAVWVGWGFVAEHAAFADLCKDIGVTFIGPDGNAMRRVSDKIAFKQLAERANAPVTPWSGGPVSSLEEATQHAERIGFPLMIKAAAGGGGRGIRRVDNLGAVSEAYERARAEALKYFGDDSVLLEKMVTAARHIEVQVVGDRLGTVWPIGLRDCTIQRRNQKVLEEAPCPVLSPDLGQQIADAAVRVAKLAGYQNAGTVECLYDPVAEKFFLMEMNTRLQVEHPVTESTTGVDLVKLQIHIASGGLLEGDPPVTTGHAIEVRLNAEDPDNQFAPAPGRIDLLRLPNGPGIRVDTGFAEGDVIPSEFDSMVAKIIGFGRDRGEALARLRRALAETDVVVRGGMTNKSFLLNLLRNHDVAASDVDIGWLDRTGVAGFASRSHADVALIAAAIESYETAAELEKTVFFASVVRGQPRLAEEVTHPVELRYGGEAYKLEVGRIAPNEYRVKVDKTSLDVSVERQDKLTSWLSVSGRRHRVVTLIENSSAVVQVDGVPHRISRDAQNVVRAPAPGIVLSVLVKPGDTVAAGDRLLIMEAMKTEMSVVAAFAGVVEEIHASSHVQVMAGAPLIVVQPSAAGDKAPVRPRVSFVHDGGTTASVVSVPDAQDLVKERCLEILNDARRAVSGFDVDPKDVVGLVAEYDKARQVLRGDKSELTRLEMWILAAFVDILAVFRPQADPQNVHLPPTDEYLMGYLRTLEARDLPAPFLQSLRRALAHFGITSLDRSPALEEAILRMHKSNRRLDALVPVIRFLLESAVRDLSSGLATAPDFRRLLERVVETTTERFPGLSDLGLHVSYRCYDEPLFERVKADELESIESHLGQLALGGDEATRRRHVEALVDSPEIISGYLTEPYENARPEIQRTILELISRRFCSTHVIDSFEVVKHQGRLIGVAGYTNNEGLKVVVLSLYAHDDVAIAALRSATEYPLPGDLLLINLLIIQPDGVLRAEPPAAIEEYLRTQPVPTVLKRVGVSFVSGTERKAPLGHYTYRSADSTWKEETIYRGIHPAVGERLELWRLRNFETERLPSPANCFLFRVTARQNSSDERLMAFLDVRDTTAIRDESGALTHLPYLERLVMESAAAMRDALLRRPKSRMVWNRMIIYVWPSAQLPLQELRAIIQKLSRFVTNLGLEKIVIRTRLAQSELGENAECAVHFALQSGGIARVRVGAPSPSPIRTLSPYTRRVVQCRRRSLAYPYEIIRTLTPRNEGTEVLFARGDFTEYDLDPQHRLVPVDRPHGHNTANVVVGIIRNYTAKHPEGVTRVMMLGDPSMDMGALAEPECLRIIAAIDLASELRVPVEWFPVSSGAKIAMDSGTENLDWTAAVLRRIIEFTQAGGEINVVVTGVNVGAQSYWNAEATMLMHCRGILIMTQQGSMVLTGKKALDYSGGVSADDHQGIGGVERIMGPNGQAQYMAHDLADACLILFRHYDMCYVAPGERTPRRSPTSDPPDRDITTSPHPPMGNNGESFTTIGDVFSAAKNPDRKKPFDIRAIMQAVVDQDSAPLERWARMRHAETAVVWDVQLGGIPVAMIGIESRQLTRKGLIPSDGPSYWSGGTLYPLSSKKVARAINAASGNRPVVVLANLSGFDGSPESMRKLQLEYGAEIGRAVVNFNGPFVFTVVSRYHGGAYVVFSRTLNERLESAALEGSYASVIGGAPAAAVVFPNEVKSRTLQDPRLADLQRELAEAAPTAKAAAQRRYDALYRTIHGEKEREVAEQFDRVHSVRRALDVGSLGHIVSTRELRPYLIRSVNAGLERWLGSSPSAHPNVPALIAQS